MFVLKFYKNHFLNIRKIAQNNYIEIFLGRPLKPSLRQVKPRNALKASMLAFFPVVKAFEFRKSAKEELKQDDKTSKIQSVIKEADELYTKNDVNSLYTYLIQHKATDDAEILWRLCRAACDKAKSSENKDERKQLMYEAFDFIEKALVANDQIFAVHKWYAIMLDYVGEYEGTKQRLTNAFKVKEHFKKAIELNPQDATSVHLLGYWCFVFAELPWYQQKAASFIFTAPPSSTFEEALEYFLQAEKIDPNFYSRNLLYVGKTYMRLKNKDMAKKYLTSAVQYPVKTADDKEAHAEAEELLKKL